MPKHTITALGAATGMLFLGYVALVATTVYFATLRTNFSQKVETLESEVAALETHYYDAISRLGAMDVYAEGYVVPLEVGYVAQGGSLTRGATPVLTRAHQ